MPNFFPIRNESPKIQEKVAYEAEALTKQSNDNIPAPDNNMDSPKHKGGPEQQKIIDYAWQISHDLEFIYLLKAENGDITVDRLSDVVGSNGYRDIGLCQMNKGFQSSIVKDKRFFDYKWQLEQCLNLYRGGVTFYGARHMKTSPAFRARIVASFS